jgi:hypothetical protein
MKVVRGCARKSACCSASSCSKGTFSAGSRQRSGDFDHLVEALVVPVSRLPEGGRVGRVDEHRHAEPRARVPDRREARVVDRDALPADVDVVHAQALVDLEPTRPGRDVGFELGDRALRPAGLADAGEIDVGEMQDASRREPLADRELRQQVVALA